MDEKKRLEAVNRSGFPLQIKTERLVNGSTNRHGWRTLLTEHAWRTADQDGFIDLVLESRDGFTVFVVECKRALNTTWIFLQPTTKPSDRRTCKAWISYYSAGKGQFDWAEKATDPPSPLSSYCVIDSEDQKSRPLLKRFAAEVVAATEAIAFEDQRVAGASKDYLRVYFSLIVTTASLKTCQFDPDAVSISDAKLTSADAVMKEVPFVRFHKQLSTNPAPEIIPRGELRDPQARAKSKEHTVFVVNVDHLIEFLCEFGWDRSPNIFQV